MLQNKLGEKDFKTVERLYEKPAEQDDSGPSFDDVTDAILAYEQQHSNDVFPDMSSLMTKEVLQANFWSTLMPDIMGSDYRKPANQTLDGKVLCLLLTEDIARNYPDPFTPEELKFMKVNLEYVDPQLTVFDGSRVSQWSQRSETGGTPAVNQWYLVLGFDYYKERTPNCWRVGVLNLQLRKKVKLKTGAIKIT
jgi:hypothetical protein